VESKRLKHTKLLAYDTVEAVFGKLDGLTKQFLEEDTLKGLYASKDYNHILVKGFLVKNNELMERDRILCKINTTWYKIRFYEEYELQTTRIVLMEKMFKESKTI